MFLTLGWPCVQVRRHTDDGDTVGRGEGCGSLAVVVVVHVGGDVLQGTVDVLVDRHVGLAVPARTCRKRFGC